MYVRIHAIHAAIGCNNEVLQMPRNNVQRNANGRRTRTTTIMVAVPTSIKAVAEHLQISPATVAKRFHRIQDAHPRSVVTLNALSESHKTAKYRGKF